MTLTVERLRELLHYDAETGLFSWRVRRSPKIGAGDRAGVVAGTGHIQIKIDNKSYYAHRLAWLYEHGAWPLDYLDHIDLVKTNNAMTNLREATMSQNRANTARRSDNSSGYKGVYWRGDHGKWQASIRKNGKSRHLGYHATAEEAHASYIKAAEQIFGEFARAA